MFGIMNSVIRTATRTDATFEPKADRKRRDRTGPRHRARDETRAELDRYRHMRGYW